MAGAAPSPSSFPFKQGPVLVTGASGFIGSWLRDALLEGGADVVSLRRPGSPPSRAGRSEVVDYTDTAGLRRLVERERPAFVFHLAGATKGVTYDDFARANVAPVRHLLDALAGEGASGLARFVLVSSLAAFGPSAPGAPHTARSTPRPIELYGRTKLEAEELLAKSAVPFTILRPGGVYGPRDVDYFELFKTATRGLNVFFGNEHRLMSTVYVDDLVRAILDAAHVEPTRGKGYFVCDGRPITWGDFQAAIVRATGRRVLTLRLPELLVDVAATFGELATRLDGRPRLFNKQKALMGAQDAWTCTHDALRDDAGYAPRVDVAEGVARTLAWYRAERWL